MSDSGWISLVNIVGLICAVITLWLKIKSGQEQTDAKVDVVHGIVNQQRTDMMAEIEALKEKIAFDAPAVARDKVVPPDQRPAT